MGVRLLQLQPLQVGFHVFRVVHVGTPQLQFIIEPWEFLIGRAGHVLSCCAAV